MRLPPSPPGLMGRGPAPLRQHLGGTGLVGINCCRIPLRAAAMLTGHWQREKLLLLG